MKSSWLINKFLNSHKQNFGQFVCKEAQNHFSLLGTASKEKEETKNYFRVGLTKFSLLSADARRLVCTVEPVPVRVLAGAYSKATRRQKYNPEMALSAFNFYIMNAFADEY
jgi:hypothetical protein